MTQEAENKENASTDENGDSDHTHGNKSLVTNVNEIPHVEAADSKRIT